MDDMNIISLRANSVSHFIDDLHIVPHADRTNKDGGSDAPAIRRIER
jgi:hypothetical protein